MEFPYSDSADTVFFPLTLMLLVKIKLLRNQSPADVLVRSLSKNYSGLNIFCLKIIISSILKYLNHL
jgi:hypothetical protein